MPCCSNSFMAIKGFAGFCWFVGSSLFFFLFFVSLLLSSGSFGHAGWFWDFLVFDYVSLVLSLISFLLFFSLWGWWGQLGRRCRIFIFFSVLMSLLSYVSSNMIIFWFSYEMSILPLLYLLVVESPYSERFVASWYLGGYIILTSVPMFLSILYLSGVLGCLNVTLVGSGYCYSRWGVFLAVFVLCVSFITKIPLFPFHSWLPIVHAESSSSVSVCLSGFIMKLGVLGVFRFGSYVLPDYVFSFFYIFLIFVISLFVFFYSCQELDGKRWLAFLSLSHIVVCVIGLNVLDYESFCASFVFCLGHGLSAGLTFFYLWFFYEICGSRNWSILKSGLSSSFFFRFLVVGVLCTVASFPPTISFFSELRIFVGGGFVSLFLSFVFYFYLFLGGLVPLFVVGGSLSVHNWVTCYSGPSFMGVYSLIFLSFFCIVLFLLF